jgi:hypothetical protein
VGEIDRREHAESLPELAFTPTSQRTRW